MGFYAPAQLVGDARRHGVPVRPVDVNHSDWDCTLEEQTRDTRHETRDEDSSCLVSRVSCLVSDSGPVLRLGLRIVGGLRSAAADALIAARADGPFRSVADLARRARLGRATLEVLADADAFGSLTLDRRAALWESLGQDLGPPNAPLFAGLDDDEPPADLPPLAPVEQVIADYHTTGLSLKGHPMMFCRADLDQLRVVPAEQLAKLPHGQRVLVAGIVLVRQRPSTAKGITFVTLEDETGTARRGWPAGWSSGRTRSSTS
jgi:error-prone DNA polymerase